MPTLGRPTIATWPQRKSAGRSATATRTAFVAGGESLAPPARPPPARPRRLLPCPTVVATSSAGMRHSTSNVCACASPVVATTTYSGTGMPARLQPLLQARLRVLAQHAADRRRRALAVAADDHARARRRSRRRRRPRRTPPPARRRGSTARSAPPLLLLALAQAQVAARVEAARDPRERLLVDERGAHARQVALGAAGKRSYSAARPRSSARRRRRTRAARCAGAEAAVGQRLRSSSGPAERVARCARASGAAIRQRRQREADAFEVDQQAHVARPAAAPSASSPTRDRVARLVTSMSLRTRRNRRSRRRACAPSNRRMLFERRIRDLGHRASRAPSGRCTTRCTRASRGTPTSATTMHHRDDEQEADHRQPALILLRRASA